MPDDTITVIPALPEHADAIRTQSAATNADHHARLPHVFRPTNSYQEQLLDVALDPQLQEGSKYQSCVFVACRDGAALGFALVIWNDPDGDNTPDMSTALIADIATFDHARGQGVSSALLTHLEGLMPEKGWKSLVADVWLGNVASHALFLKAGFDAERTEYRLGKPAPLSDPPKKGLDKPPASPNWMYIAIALLALAIIASIP